MDRNKGLYLGTEINKKWWRRYAQDKLLMRGNGEFWHDEKGFYFLRYLTKEPIFIPFDKMLEISLGGDCHSGKWAWGMPILKIIWKKDEDVLLSSGFFVSKDKAEIAKLKETLERKLGIAKGSIKSFMKNWMKT